MLQDTFTKCVARESLEPFIVSSARKLIIYIFSTLQN